MTFLATVKTVNIFCLRGGYANTTSRISNGSNAYNYFDGVCYNCDERGHRLIDCPSRAAEVKANMQQQRSNNSQRNYIGNNGYGYNGSYKNNNYTNNNTNNKRGSGYNNNKNNNNNKRNIVNNNNVETEPQTNENT